jgi:hypothetical protein
VNCRNATYLIEKKQISCLKNAEESDLKLHLANCAGCRLFEQQSILINQMVHHLFQEPKLDGEFKKQLQDNIEKWR